MSRHTIKVIVNGQAEELEVPAHRLLSELLRDDLHLIGTKRGCEAGICGACSVHVDGRVVKSCLMLAIHVDGCEVQTVEGLAQAGQLHPLQESFMTCGGLQCGYCTPGMLMTAKALLAENPHPTEAQVRQGLSGNLCRCTGYNGIVDAILEVAEARHGA